MESEKNSESAKEMKPQVPLSASLPLSSTNELPLAPLRGENAAEGKNQHTHLPLSVLPLSGDYGTAECRSEVTKYKNNSFSTVINKLDKEDNLIDHSSNHHCGNKYLRLNERSTKLEDTLQQFMQDAEKLLLPSLHRLSLKDLLWINFECFQQEFQKVEKSLIIIHKKLDEDNALITPSTSESDDEDDTTEVEAMETSDSD
ncbi:hypothetical protein LR48_Vigan10g064000 [Vigna angularis]|uniref:Uncharacterized protein n=1 Tax=Phaseolus angularis TaxID=3914 RepID=A0A0L9VID0_PHAAN|nr:hypothetical protein LR48_Vigan10g064000 [Vigna angularis]